MYYLTKQRSMLTRVSLYVLFMFVVIGMASISSRALAQQGAPAEVPVPTPQTIITVDTTTDPDPTDLRNTCGYTQGALFVPATPCSFRRAVLEAAARPQEDRPILIRFDIPTSEPGYDGTLDAWTLTVDDTLPPLKTPTILDKNGEVYIDGSPDLGDPAFGGRTDAPRIIINSDFSLEVESENNVIQNLAWQGGGVIFLKEDGNTVENIWMGLNAEGTDIFLREPSNPFRLAGGGINAASNNNVISGTVVSGAFARAIDIQGNNNVVTNNFVGTRADGTVPAVAENTKCLRSLSYDPNNWYGGWGLQIAGSNNQITNNVIAGLHILQSENDTPPITLEIDGSMNTIQNNTIGVDGAGNEVGVCGIGALVSGTQINIWDNTFVNTRKGFEEAQSDTTVYISGNNSDQISVRRNIMRDGPLRAINFAGTIPDSWRFFEPAQITNINGTAVVGTNAEGDLCPNCLVDIYLDDTDNLQEALAYLGTATADGNGDFTFTLPAPLAAGEGLRTVSVAQSFGVIGNRGTDTITQMSDLFLPIQAPESVTITGPTTGSVDTEYVFNILVSPATTTLPLDFTVSATDKNPSGGSINNVAATYTVSWSTPGTKTITVTAENEGGSVTNTYTIVISEEVSSGTTVYLPLITR
jgi:hypothetical protein